MGNTGIQHKDRHLKELEAEYFKVDERSLNDFIDFTLKYSHLVNFYNINDDVDGDASTILGNDITFLLIQISSIDLKSVEKKFDSIVDRIHIDKQAFREALSFLFEQFTLVETWSEKTTDEFEFNNEIIKLIENKFSKYIAKLIAYEDLLISNTMLRPRNKFHSFLMKREWQAEEYYYENTLSALAPEAQLKEAINLLYGIFNSTLSSTQLVITSSKNYVQKIMKSGNTQPHIALFIAFIEIYKLAQNDINKFTQRHLDYFYTEILKFKKQIEIPDKVHLTFELQEGMDLYKLNKGTQMLAGQDVDGNDLIYELDEELVVSTADIDKKRAIVNDREALAKPGKQFEYVFLNDNINKNLFEEEEKAEGESFEMGFALASSFLKLSEGDRNVTFTLEMQRYAYEDFLDKFENEVLTNTVENVDSIDEFVGGMFLFSYSTVVDDVQEWFLLPKENVHTVFQKNVDGNCINKLNVTVTIDKLFPPVEACISDEFKDAKERELPLCKFLIDNEKLLHYNYYKLLIVEKVEISTGVEGIRDLRIQNDYGSLDPEIPFEPFGAIPGVGATFYIGHDTIFSQKLDELQLVFDWFDVPIEDDGFPEYYQGYNYVETNDVFKAKLSVLKDRNWIPEDNQQVISLFQDGETNPETGGTPVDNIRLVDDIDLQKINFHFKGAPIINNNESYSRISTNGFIKMEFLYPPTGFGTKEYPDLVTRIANSATAKSGMPKMPNSPWLPTMRSISVNYKSSIIIDIHNQERKNRAFVYHLHPFGEKLVSEPVGSDIHLFPEYPEGTEILMGIKNFNEYEVLNIFFHINEFASDFMKEKSIVKWSFLNNDEWEEIKYDQIISDTTNDLSNSGIIMFDFPSFDKDFFNHSTFATSKSYEAGYFWLKCTSVHGEQFVKNITEIKCHAGQATYTNINNSPEHLEEPLPANSINVFVDEHPEIKLIRQSFPSFAGKAEESQLEFQTRVSERLNHKDRAISEWDYEHIILQEFPDIHKVTCLNNVDKTLKITPGNVLVVVLPRIAKDTDEVILEPKTTAAKLQSIQELVENRVSTFVKIQATNPIYEHVQVKFDVKFHSGLNERYYLQKVNEDITAYLNPWLVKDDAPLAMSNSIYSMHIVYFLETRDYIDYVSNLSLFHIAKGNIVNLETANDNNTVITPQTEISIFVSAPDHLIKVVGADDRQEAIGSLIIGKDFSAGHDVEPEIIEGINKDQIEISHIVGGDTRLIINEDEYVLTFNKFFS